MENRVIISDWLILLAIAGCFALVGALLAVDPNLSSDLAYLASPSAFLTALAFLSNAS